jgi:hypothetical protein
MLQIYDLQLVAAANLEQRSLGGHSISNVAELL